MHQSYTYKFALETKMNLNFTTFWIWKVKGTIIKQHRLHERYFEYKYSSMRFPVFTIDWLYGYSFSLPPPPNSPKNINMHFMVKSQFPIVKSDLCKYQKYRINTEKENTQLEYNITANAVLIYREIKSF